MRSWYFSGDGIYSTILSIGLSFSSHWWLGNFFSCGVLSSMASVSDSHWGWLFEVKRGSNFGVPSASWLFSSCGIYSTMTGIGLCYWVNWGGWDFYSFSVGSAISSSLCNSDWSRVDVVAGGFILPLSINWWGMGSRYFNSLSIDSTVAGVCFLNGACFWFGYSLGGSVGLSVLGNGLGNNGVLLRDDSLGSYSPGSDFGRRFGGDALTVKLYGQWLISIGASIGVNYFNVDLDVFNLSKFVTIYNGAWNNHLISNFSPTIRIEVGIRVSLNKVLDLSSRCYSKSKEYEYFELCFHGLNVYILLWIYKEIYSIASF